tara:strand:- start:547 stop:1266 length:720 start_codon:yes stop_codon:yes gene_type:complete
MNFNKITFLIPLCLIISCSEQKEASLNNFIKEDDVFESGKSLITLSYGLHDLEQATLDQKTLLIGVHGSNSRGYEWVYPLATLNKEANLVSFFRWNDDACPGPSITSLYALIDTKFEQNPNLEKVILLGHSYGGLLVAAFTDKWDKEISLEAHSIAAPLKGMGALKKVCDYQIPLSLSPDTTFYEWRTIKELDGAFRDLDFDPQEVEIENSRVTRLPETYKGNKLGHNWSISWVADEIK